MLPKRQRVTRALFSDIMSRGKVFHSAIATLRILPIKNASYLRHTGAFSIVVSKKVARRAVARNTLRRRAYRALSSVFEKMQNPHIGVFFLKKNAQELVFGELENEFETLLRKAGAISS